MRTPRVYLPIELNPGARIELDEYSAHHVRAVLRLKKGNSLRIFNGLGSEFNAVLATIDKRSVRVDIGEAKPCYTESELPIHFGLAISRGERMDFAIRKSVELGVSDITPLITERCVIKLDESRSDQKQSHWQRIAISASEQSGRARVPEIRRPIPFKSWINNNDGLKVILDPSSSRTLNDLGSAPRSVCLLSGPEGGFSAHERAQAIEAGFAGVNIGPRILRTETAALAGMVLIQAIWGDLGLRGGKG